MIFRLLILIGLLCARTATADPAADSLFLRGNALFDDGFYAEAAEVYQDIESRGYASAELDLNLGLALYRSGSPGEGVYYVARAARTPRVEAQARRHLETMRGESSLRQGAIDAAGERSFVVGLWTLGAGLIVIGGVTALAAARMRRGAAVAVAAGIAFTAVSVAWSASAGGTSEGVVVRGPAVVYESYDSLAPSGLVLQEGETVVTRGAMGARIEIAMGGNRKGWIDRHRVREF